MKAAVDADYSVDHFLQYLKAQDLGYDGPFQQYSREMWPRDADGNILELPGAEASEEADAEASEEADVAASKEGDAEDVPPLLEAAASDAQVRPFYPLVCLNQHECHGD